MSANTTGIRFLYNFLVGEYDLNNPGSNVVSVTSTYNGDYDKKNLTSTPLRESWRSATAVGWQEIIMKTNDLTAVPDVFAILNHNLTELAVVQLQASMTSDFLTPAFTLTFQYNEKHMIIQQNVGLAYKYYRFRILDPSNPCGFIEVGKIIAGKAFTFTKNEDITDDISVRADDLAYKMKTEGFFRAFNERVKVDKLEIRFARLGTVPGENDNFLGLKKMVNSVGETYPFLTIVDPADPYFQLLWGQIDSLPSLSYSINRFVTLSFSLQEIY